MMSKPYEGTSTNSGVPGIRGNNSGGDGVVGVGHRGVVGKSLQYQGVFGQSTGNAGIVGESQDFHGVYGVSHSVHNAALFGTNDAAGFGVIGRGLIGITGESTGGLQGLGVLGSSPGGDGVVGRGHRGVRGESDEYQGVSGYSKGNAGVFGESEKLIGVYAISHDQRNAGLYATNDGGGAAAFFEGDIYVTGAIHMLGGDIAEDFDAEDGAVVLPGSVVCIADSGRVGVTTRPYDTTVIGIVAGAPGFRPAVRLDSTPNGNTRLPVTLMGKVMCLVDATSAPVRAGDLLTSSETSGHAMKIISGERSVGAIVGKALRSLDRGRGLVPVLAMLR
jgi:hypothetical protein